MRVKRLISFPLEAGGNVLIEVEEEGGGPLTRGLHPSEVIETVGVTFEAALEAIKPAAIAVASKFRDLFKLLTLLLYRCARNRRIPRQIL